MNQSVTFIKPNHEDARLVTRRYRMVIGGTSVDAASGETIDRDSPAHPGVTVGVWPRAERVDVDLAIAAARRAFDEGPWPRMSAAERSRLMFKVAERILDRQEELATIESLEVGKPIAQARGEIGFCADLWGFAAGQIRGLQGDAHNDLGPDLMGLVFREPIGVVGIVTPWNFPFIIASERVPWAIGAGCTVVVKPSEFTSGTTIRLAELAREAGIPDGVVNVVTGFGDPAGQMLAEDPRTDMVAFTGSVRVGRIVGALAAASVKRVGLELGGKGPQVVFADADLDAAVDGIAYGVYHNAGQCCISGSRLIVERSMAEPLLERLVAMSRRLVIGDPLNESTKLGALITAAHRDKIERHVAEGREAGARVLVGGERLGNGDDGLFYAPTVFDRVEPGMTIATEEIFGPVLSTLVFDTPEEAVRLANATPFGLSASVWSRDISRAFAAVRGIRAGRMWINGVIDGAPELPIGGFKQSGLGRELGRYGFDEYSEFKSVHVVLGRHKPWATPI